MPKINQKYREYAYWLLTIALFCIFTAFFGAISGLVATGLIGILIYENKTIVALSIVRLRSNDVAHLSLLERIPQWPILALICVGYALFSYWIFVLGELEFPAFWPNEGVFFSEYWKKLEQSSYNVFGEKRALWQRHALDISIIISTFYTFMMIPRSVCLIRHGWPSRIVLLHTCQGKNYIYWKEFIFCFGFVTITILIFFALMAIPYQERIDFVTDSIWGPVCWEALQENASLPLYISHHLGKWGLVPLFALFPALVLGVIHDHICMLLIKITHNKSDLQNRATPPEQLTDIEH